MKQRLLLALLMLFSSVGFMKAQASDPITIGVPKDAKVTITLTSRSFTFTSESYPQLYSGSDVVTPEGGVDKLNSKTVKWILEPEATTNYELSTATNDDSWGNLSLSLDGKVTSFVVSGAATNKFQELITSLSFTNNGVLEQLVLAQGRAHETTGLPNLKELSCSGNKLIWIPAKPTNMEASKYNIGTQILDVTLSGSTTNSKEGVSFSVSNLQVSGVSGKVFSSLKGYNITNAKDKDGNAVTVKKVADNKFVFTKGDIFFDGELTFDVEVTDTNYPGVIISGVKTTISVPTFTLKTENLKFDSKQGTINSNINFGGSKTVKKGDKIVLTPVPEDGYEFDKFTSYKGVSEPTLDGNAYTFTVLGDVDPVIEAAFKAKGATVTYNTPDAAQGTLRVTKAENNELVASGNTVPVGTKLLITAKAKDGYEVGNVSFKEADKKTEISSIERTVTGTDTEKTWTYENVTIDGLDVQATFTALRKSLTIEGNSVSLTSIKDTEDGNYPISGNVYEIPVGKELIIVFSSSAQSGVINYAIFNSKKYDVVKKQDGSYELKGIVMPNQNSKLVFETSTLQNITVTPAWTNDVELPYTGTKQEVTFTFDKNVDANSFVVEYKKASDDDKAYTKEAFKEVGDDEYMVRITRPADDKYKEVNEEVTYKIVKANLIVEAPAVNVDKDGNISFTNGNAYFMNGDQKVDVEGKFVALASGGTTEITNITDNDNGDGKLKVTYKVTDASVAPNLNKAENFILQYGKELATAKIQAVGEHKGDLTFTMNSISKNQPMVLPDGSSVAVGTEVSFQITKTAGIDDDSNYKVYQANANGEKLNDTPIKEYTIQKGDKELYFLLEVEDKRAELALSDQAKKYIQKGKFEYEAGTAKTFAFEKGSSYGLYFVDKEGKEIVDENLYKPEFLSVTYWKKNGGQVAEAIDAGVYQVKIARKASPSYKEFEEVTLDFTINPDDIPESIDVPTPTASMIGKGQTLGTSKLSGNAEIAGEYRWDDGNNKIVNATEWFSVTFYPEDKNYKPKQIKQQVEVKVSDKPILTITCDETKGTVKVYDGDGNYYYDGDAIDVHQLTFEADPAEGYAFESYSVIHGGTQSTEKTAIFTTTPTGSSIDVTVNFKEKSAETVYHTISFSSLNVAGVVFDNVSTSNKVKEGDSFNFSMSAHPSDCSRIVVKDNNGKSYAVSSLGACTIDNVQKDLQLTVSLSNPTKYDVTLPAEYKDSEGNLMGTANFSGNTYYGGTITLTAVPKEGYKFVGWLNAGTTSTATTVQVTVTSNMTIFARFESDGTIDPNTECIVRTPYDEDLTGVSINKQGVNVVKIGSDFEFTVAAYKDDLARVKVTVDGAELKPTTGNKYVISKVKKNTEVKVTLDNPTRIKVVIEKETKNAKGYVMGHVDVDVVDFGTYYPDSTCYYNTKLRLAAYPESGVEFKNWSDVTSNTDLIREITVTDNVTIKPVFEGTPTGIEDIMAASIATGKGCVWVRGIANADVTIVSISGRVQARQRISGDTRINVPAGIYVVVLESGSDVKRVKVIVK